jgi:D-3-phosphoglycerate dehydrogenase
MEKNNILILEPLKFSEHAKRIIKKIGNVTEGPMTRDELLACIDRFEILIIRLGHIIDKEIITKAKRLKVIVSPTTGLDHIDTIEADKNKIVVLSLRNERLFLDTIFATAEHTWALMLALVRNIIPATQHVKKGGWERDHFRGNELYGKKLGILGLGRIGCRVGEYGIAFGMEVMGYDISQHCKNPKIINKNSLDSLIEDVDILSIHVTSSQKNNEIIGHNELKKIKKGALLINTSRGNVINEKALIDSLNSKHLGGAALDVLQSEYSNSENSTLLINYINKNSNLIVTPHIGGCTIESMAKTEIFMASKLLNFVNS